MKLKILTIENFRCFEHYELKFTDGINVLIGKNGTGKTNALQAILAGLSFIFASDQKTTEKSGREKPNPLYTNGFGKMSQFVEMDARYQFRTFEYPMFVEVGTVIGSKDLPLARLEKISEKSTKVKADGYKKALHAFVQNHISTEKSLYPLLAYYSDGFPHNPSKLSKRISGFVNSPNPLPRFLAYHQWDTATSNALQWQHRYIVVKNRLQDEKSEMINAAGEIDFLEGIIAKQVQAGAPDVPELEEKMENLMNAYTNRTKEVYNSGLENEEGFVTHRIRRFTEPVRPDFNFINWEFSVRQIIVNRTKSTSDYDMQFEFSNGRSMRFEQLPMGYRRLLSIVFDISYRAFTLNGIVEPEGIVIIDEIELHLHPSLAQEVLDRFRKTFPNIQFIVSTHSPLVISNLKKEEGKNQIIKLSFDGKEYKPEYLDNFYGASYDTSLNEVMESFARTPKIDFLIDTYLHHKRKGKEAEAKTILLELEDLAGPLYKSISEEIARKLKLD